MDNAVNLRVNCISCSKLQTLTLPAGGYRQWRHGVSVQEAFPDESAETREMLTSGVCPACWNRMEGDVEEEDEMADRREEAARDARKARDKASDELAAVQAESSEALAQMDRERVTGVKNALVAAKEALARAESAAASFFKAVRAKRRASKA